MWGIEILLVFTVVVLAQGTNSSPFRNWQSSWIEGGPYAAPGEFPYMVSVRNQRSSRWDFCGGSIINTWYILTAAHCVLGASPARVKVLIGTNELYKGGLKLGVTRIIKHHSFEASIQNNDVALLRLMKPVVYDSKVHPVRLPNQGERIGTGMACMLTGWGYTSSSSTALPNSLRKLQVTTVSNNECNNNFKFISDTKICATAGTGKGICKGDTGGPLICGGKQFGVLIGEQTQKAKCTGSLPTAYVYVPKYTDWIRSHAV